MILLFFLVWLLDPGMLLVLKNGKTLKCDSFEVKGRMVEVAVNGASFTLPVTSVDLDRSGEIQPEEPREQQQVGEKHPRQDHAPRKEAGKPIQLTTKDLKSGGGSGKPGSTLFRKIGNSIIVEVGINGSGPFSILLDTGANTTVISPSLLEQLRAITDSKPISMVGLSGQPVEGLEFTLDEISLAGQKINGMRAVSFDIPHLREMDVVGLLGQDFLNHFVVELDASINQLTLSPHGKPVEASALEKQSNLETHMALWEQNVQQLQHISQALRRIVGQVLQGSVALKDQKVSRDLRQYLQEMSQIRTTANDYKNSLTQIDLNLVGPPDRQRAQQFLDCFPRLSSYLEEMQVLCGSLRNYVNTDNSSRLAESFSQMERRSNELKSCLRQGPNPE